MKQPTPEQIDHLRKNCYFISLWLDHTHLQLADVINEIYDKLSQSSEDPGQHVMTNVMDLIFAGIGDVDFPGAAITGYAIQSLMGSYQDNTPSSLQNAFGDLWGRFGATFQQAQSDFGDFSQNPDKHWNEVYTDPVSGKSFTVSDLADPNVFFPTQDPEYANTQFFNPDAFNDLTGKTIVSSRYNITKMEMGKKWSILHDPKNEFWDGWTDDDARKFAQDQVDNNREVFLVWWPDQDGSCAGCPNNGMSTNEPRIGVGDWYSNWDYYHGDVPTKEMCDWLMQDDGYGKVLNPDAVTTRRDVFYNWPLQGNLNDHPVHSKKPRQKQEITKESKRRARGWHEMFGIMSRSELERELIQKAVDDPVFKAHLIKNPKEAIEKHFDLPIPDEVRIEVVLERPGDYKIVLPYVGRPRRSS